MQGYLALFSQCEHQFGAFLSRGKGMGGRVAHFVLSFENLIGLEQDKIFSELSDKAILRLLRMGSSSQKE